MRPSLPQRANELAPQGLGFVVADLEAEQLPAAIAIDAPWRASCGRLKRAAPARRLVVILSLANLAVWRVLAGSRVVPVAATPIP